MMWSERYRPASIGDMVGNEKARSEVMEWFLEWKPGAKPLLLTGPPGIGKTTIASIASVTLGYDMVEMNASDARSKSRINRMLGPTLTSTGLRDRMMIFVDEVDGIHGSSDYGGGEALLRLLKKPPIPIVMASNSQDTAKMKSIAKASKMVQFQPVPPRLLRMRLVHVLKQEGATLGPGAIIRTISQSQGDMRALLNLAQSMVTGFRPETGRSVTDMDAQNGVEAFFSAKSPDQATLMLYTMQINPRDKINAFYSSVVTSTLEAPKMARLLRVLSQADMLYGRIMATQNWRLLRYLNTILTGMYGNDTTVQYAQYNLPFPAINRIRFDSGRIGAINKWLGKQLHMSASAAASIATPYYMALVQNGTLEAPEEFLDIIAKEAKS